MLQLSFYLIINTSSNSSADTEMTLITECLPHLYTENSSLTSHHSLQEGERQAIFGFGRSFYGNP